MIHFPPYTYNEIDGRATITFYTNPPPSQFLKNVRLGLFAYKCFRWLQSKKVATISKECKVGFKSIADLIYINTIVKNTYFDYIDCTDAREKGIDISGIGDRILIEEKYEQLQYTNGERSSQAYYIAVLLPLKEINP